MKMGKFIDWMELSIGFFGIMIAPIFSMYFWKFGNPYWYVYLITFPTGVYLIKKTNERILRGHLINPLKQKNIKAI